MSLLRALHGGLRTLFRKSEVEQDLDDELRHYLEMVVQERMRAGMTRLQAERAARLDIGGVEATKEEVRSAGWEASVESLWRDLLYALRGLRRNPGFTTIAILTLALGIGANAAMFSVVRAVMLRPLPYTDPGRLALLWTDDTKRGLHEEGTAYSTIADWREQNHAFSGIGYYSTMSLVLSGASNTRERMRTRSAYVSSNVFSVLGVAPVFGRLITVDDERSAAPVAVISHALWQRRYGGDVGVLGKALDVEVSGKTLGTAPQIVGVMPPGFYFPDKATEFWIPATTYWRWNRERSERFPGWTRRWTAIGRLRPSMSIADARADMANIGQQLSIAYPSTVPDFPGFGVNVVPILDHVTGKTLQFALWILLGAVALVLLIACANVANLTLARGATRQQEFAIRRALGAGRGRLVRQQLGESLALAVGGGAAGMVIALAGTKLLSLAATSRIPRLEEVSVDGWVLAFTTLLSLAAGVVFGLAPAVRSAGANPSEALKEGSGQTIGNRKLRRARGMLVIAECALAVVLLTGAGLLLRSLTRLQTVDPGFTADGVLAVRIEFPTQPAPTIADRLNDRDLSRARATSQEALLHDVGERIAAIPGVEGVAFDDDVFIGDDANESITIPGRAIDSLGTGQLYVSAATPGFLELMRVQLRRGRYLTRADARTKIQALWSPVNTDMPLAEKEARAIPEPVVVNEAFAQRFFPNEDPLGKKFCIDPTNKTYWFQIVGVVANMRRQGLERSAIPEFFETFLPMTSAEILVRTRSDPLAAAPTIRRLVSSTLPGAIVLNVTTVDRRLEDFSAQRRFQTWLLGAFAALAMVLAAIGIYGVVHYAVAERRREIGVRIALGATTRDVLRMVVGQGMRWPVVGISVGIVGAFLLTRVMSHLLFEVGATDPVTFVGVTIVLGVSATIACYFPARRATRIDPVAALRQD